MIIDAHIHLWDRIDGDIGVPVRPRRNGIVTVGGDEVLGMPPYFTDCRATADLALAAMDAEGVDAAVVTQEYLDGPQNGYLATIERRWPERFFVHGLLDFREPETVLGSFHALMDAHPFRGVKLPAQWLARREPRIRLTDPRIMEVFSLMAERGMVLSADLEYGGTQVAEMREVARAYPGMPVVLGHFACVNRPGWREQLALGREPAVHIETGGVTWLFRSEGPPFPSMGEALRTAAGEVGTERLMWGSDFPRTLVDVTYGGTLDWLRHGCGFLTDGERAAILGGNARRLYGFAEPAAARGPVTRITEYD